MKRILFACFLLTAAGSFTSVQQAAAQAAAPTPVSAADFTAKVNQLDAQISSGDMATAKSTWTMVQGMMKSQLGTTKGKIASAATPADRDLANANMKNEVTIYQMINTLKNDLAANRAAIHTKLVAFAATM